MADNVVVARNTENAPKCPMCSQTVAFSHYNNLSAQLPVDPKTGAIVEGGVKEQAEQCFRNIAAIVASIDHDLNDVVRVTIFVKDIMDIDVVERAYKSFFTTYVPARTIVAVNDLPMGALVQVEALLTNGEGTIPNEPQAGDLVKYANNTHNAPFDAMSTQSVAFSHYNNITAQLPIDPVSNQIVMGGVQGGIEKFSKAVMPALGIILIGIIIFVAMQPGALEGYKFMFKPDMSLFSNPGSFFDVLKTASGQVFFSLSMAMGINITFGSYLDKQKSLQKNAVIVPLFDTIFAVLAGMMILPACAAFHVDYAQGPGLLFASMQKVFLDGMGGQAGNIIGFLFYFLVFIAAVTSSIALMEVLTSAVVDRQLDKGKEPNRKKTALLFAVLQFLIGIPVALDALGSGGAVVKAPYELLGLTTESAGFAMWNDCWLDFYDMLTEGIMMPLGALLMSLLMGWVFPNLVKDECEQSGHQFKGAGYFKFCFRFVIPIIMVIVLITQIQSFFL